MRGGDVQGPRYSPNILFSCYEERCRATADIFWLEPEHYFWWSSSSYFERVIDVEVNVKQKNRLQKNTSFVAAAENPRIDCEYSKSAS